MLLVAEPVLGLEEKAALTSVIESGWITMGDRVREFEIEFARRHGARDSVASSSPRRRAARRATPRRR